MPDLLATHSFTALVEQNPALRTLRHEHAAIRPEERRKAAAWSYETSMAEELWNAIPGMTERSKPKRRPHRGQRESWPSASTPRMALLYFQSGCWNINMGVPQTRCACFTNC